MIILSCFWRSWDYYRCNSCFMVGSSRVKWIWLWVQHPRIPKHSDRASSSSARWWPLWRGGDSLDSFTSSRSLNKTSGVVRSQQWFEGFCWWLFPVWLWNWLGKWWSSSWSTWCFRTSWWDDSYSLNKEMQGRMSGKGQKQGKQEKYNPPCCFQKLRSGYGCKG